MKKVLALFFSLIFLLCTPFASPVIKGSQTALSVQPHATFPASDLDNTMLGFGWFKNGFTFEDATASCTFDSVYPLSGPIDLNGGSLYLASDLLLHNNITWTGFGSLYGNYHLLDLCKTVTFFASPSQQQIFNDVSISMHTDMRISGSALFQGSSLLDGNNNILKFNDGGYLLVDTGATLTLKDMTLAHVEARKICCLDDSSRLALENVTLLLSNDYSFTQGSMYLMDEVVFDGAHTFSYQSNQTSTIAYAAHLKIEDGLILSLGKDEQDSAEPLYFEGSLSSINFQNSTLLVHDEGVNFTRGIVSIDRNVNFDVYSSSTMQGLICGNQNEVGDILLQFFPSSNLNFKRGHITFNGTNADVITSAGNATLVRYDNTIVQLNQNLIASEVDIFSYPMAQFYAADDSSFIFEGCRFRFADSAFQMTNRMFNQFVAMYAGNDQTFIEIGSLGTYNVIQNTDNIIYGNGDLTGPVSLYDSDAELILKLDGVIDDNVYINNGKLFIKKDIYFAPNRFFHGPGIVEIDNCIVSLGEKDLSITDTIVWNGDNGHVCLNSNVSLSATWTFQGNCTLSGNGNSLDLRNGGNLVVDSDASLIIKHMRVEGISGNNIKCINDSSSITFNDVALIQDSDYSFTTGSFLFKDYNLFSGAYTFSYESNQTSTIEQNAQLKVADNMRFVVGKQVSVESTEPLYFEHDTSTLMFENASLVVNGFGVNWTNGIVAFNRNVEIEIHSTTTSNGMIIGNGLSSGNMYIDFYPSSVITYKQGHWSFNGTNSDVLRSRGNALFVRKDGTIIYLNQDAIFSDLTVFSYPTAQFYASDGCAFIFDGATAQFADSSFKMKNRMYNQFTATFAGGDEVFIEIGSLGTYSVIQGMNNKIYGKGDITGPVALANSLAELILKLDGVIDHDVYLNGGLLNIQKTIAMAPNRFLHGPGTVRLTSCALMLGNKDLFIDDKILWDMSSGHVDLHSKVSLSTTWTFKGNGTLDGHGNTLSLASGGELVVDDDATFKLKNIRIEGISANNIRCLNDSASLKLNNVLWVQDGNYSFTTGSILFEEDSIFSGAYTFSYESNQTSTISQNSMWKIMNDLILSIGRKDAIEPLYFEDNTSILSFRESSFYVTGSGMQLTNGVLQIISKVKFDIASTESENSLKMGNGDAEHDLLMLFKPGATVEFGCGAFYLDNIDENKFLAPAGKVTLLRDANSIFYLNRDIMLSDFKFITDNSSSIVPLNGAVLKYTNCTSIFDGVEFTVSGERYNGYTVLLNGNKEIFVTRGLLPAYAMVQGIGNTIRGNGSISGKTTLLDSDAEIHFDYNGSILNDIDLNGGTVILDDDLKLSQDAIVTGEGKIVLGSSNLCLGTKNNTWTGTAYFDGNEGRLDLNSMISLSGTWTFSGTCIVDGNWHTLELLPSANIIVESGSILIFKNTKIKNLSGAQLRCQDDTAKIWFDDSKIKLDGNFTFSKGSFSVFEKLEIRGTYAFEYQSSMSSYIEPCSNLRMIDGSLFSYAPLSTDRELIVMQGDYSELELYGATLHSTTTGICLTKGILSIYGESKVSSDATCEAEGICFGDGISEDNDLLVDVKPNADWEITSGYVVNKNL